ncbi:MAG: AEC family transporter [Christensenellales bacterium]|jgi:predicted permease
MGLVVWDAVQAVLVIALLTFAGWFFCRVGWFDSKKTGDMIVRLVIEVTFPCMIVTNLWTYFTREILASAGAGLLMGWGSIFTAYLISWPLCSLLKIPKGRRGLFKSMFSLSNSMFVGLPVSKALFGDAGIPYALFYYIATTTTLWTLAHYTIRRDGEGEGRISFKEVIQKLMSPPLLTFLISISLILIGFTPPKIVLDVAGYLGVMTTPLSLFFSGIIIYKIGLKGLKMEKGIPFVMLSRFILSPLIMLLIGTIIKADKLMLSVMVIQASMPVMLQASILGERYGADAAYATNGFVWTSLLSFVFIPFYMVLFSLI